ncbi:hypothetical protein MPER_04673, partial [Moniliophthora perniciosa FA553]
ADILNEAAFAGKLLITAEDNEAAWQKRIEKFFTNARDNKKKRQRPPATAGSEVLPPPPVTSRSTMRLAVKAIQKFCSEVVDGKAAFNILKKAEIEGEVDEDNTFESVADALWVDEVEKEKYEEAALGMHDLAENQHQFLMATLETLNACAQYGHIGKAVMQLFWMFPNTEGPRRWNHHRFTVKWDPAIPDMIEECADDLQTMHELFQKWAGPHVPVQLPKSDIEKDKAGRPRFPPLDLEHTTPAEVRKSVAEYFEALRFASGYKTALPFDMINKHPGVFYDDTKFQLPTLHNPDDKSQSVDIVARYFIEKSGPDSLEPFQLRPRDEIESRLNKVDSTLTSSNQSKATLTEDPPKVMSSER